MAEMEQCQPRPPPRSSRSEKVTNPKAKFVVHRPRRSKKSTQAAAVPASPMSPLVRNNVFRSHERNQSHGKDGTLGKENCLNLPPESPLSPLEKNTPVKRETLISHRHERNSNQIPISSLALSFDAAASVSQLNFDSTSSTPLEAPVVAAVPTATVTAPAIQDEEPISKTSPGEKTVPSAPKAVDKASAPKSGVAAAAFFSKMKKKCKVVQLADAATSLGHPSFGNFAVGCAALRCLECDFAVMRFSGQAWAPETSYLFLRLNVDPSSPEKLDPMLVPCPGASAYACQCSWRTVSKGGAGGSGVEKVNHHGNILQGECGKCLRWCCAGH
mmetsp:Transcript_16387/g.32650  ORF Transcript_16387/g.32650 Transcript_16387/m.32650 type:complete len:329 (-) Transcript_16387:226-1212(-)